MVFAPASLDTTVPGSIGIIGDTRSVALDRMTTIIRFEEEPAGMPFADDASGLDELSAPAGTSAPTKAPGVLGRVAVFGGAAALQGKDLQVGSTLLPRDLTVQAMIAWDIAAQDSHGESGTIIARGLGTGAIEYMPFALELNVIDAASRTGEVRWLWHTTAGVLKTQTGASFICPPAGNFFLLTATRRWISPTSVVIRYYANDQLLGEVTSVDGSIAASVDGTTTIGTRYTGAYTHLLLGSLDDLAIFNFEMCREEIEATWLRISLYQPDGYRQISDLMPPGIRISNDPNSQIQSDLRSMGLGLGLADAQIENMRANMMPDRAYGDVLRRWETVTRQPPRPGDSIDTRRKRVLGHLRKRGGCSPSATASALADLLACDASQLASFAFDNTIRESWPSIRAERWSSTAGWTALGGAARVQAVAGTYTWDGMIPGGLAILTGTESPRGHNALAFNGVSIFGSLTPTALPANAEAGFILRDWARGHMLFFGLRNVAGSYKVGYQRFRGNVAIDGAFVVLATTAAVKHWLRIRPPADATMLGLGDDDQNYQLSWSTVGQVEANFTTAADLLWARSLGWAGLYFRTNGATAGASDVRFGNEFALRNTKGTRPYNWYLYRDPAIGGAPDLAGAQAVLARMRHGYVHAAVITTKSLLCNTAPSGCNLGPMGVLDP